MPENNQQAATRQDLAVVKADPIERIDIMEVRLSQRIERFETTILNAFSMLAREQDLRSTALESRLSAVESRLVEIELQLGMRGPNQS